MHPAKLTTMTLPSIPAMFVNKLVENSPDRSRETDLSHYFCIWEFFSINSIKWNLSIL